MRRRFHLFFVIATLLLAIFYGYMGWRLELSPFGWAGLAMPYLLIVLLPLLYWGSSRRPHSLLGLAFQWGSYASMGLLSFLLVVLILRDVTLIVTGWDAGSNLVVYLALGLTAVGVAMTYGGPWVRTVEVAIPDLDEALQGLRVVQISDLHVGPTIRLAYVERVVRRVNALAPDLVALTGDIIDGRVDQLARHVAPLSGLKPAGRVFFVPGNHEYYWNVEAWCAHFTGLGATVLLNAGTSIEHSCLANRAPSRIHIGGVTDPTAIYQGYSSGPDVDAAAGDAPLSLSGAALKLLLAHQPQIAPLAEKAGFHAQLSGHTHAGQFFPWTLVVPFFHRHYAGLSRQGKLWVYVSAGTGTWGPPMRLGTIPEITLLRFVRGAATDLK